MCRPLPLLRIAVFSALFWRQDEKKTLKEKVLSVQEVTSLVQSSLGYLASLTERILKCVTDSNELIPSTVVRPDY